MRASLTRVLRKSDFFSSRLITQKKIFCFSDKTEPKVEENQTTKPKQKKIYRFSLSPHAYWLTQAKGMEKPFTGDYWFTKETGHYQCIACSKKLFLSEHKFFPPTGMASFWTHLPKSVEIVSDVADVKENNENITDFRYLEQKEKQRCVCAHCKSHLGLVYMDGPAPTFLRFSINSGCLKFKEKPWFENPLRIRERKKEKRLRERRRNAEIVLPEFEFDRKYETIIQK